MTIPAHYKNQVDKIYAQHTSIDVKNYNINNLIDWHAGDDNSLKEDIRQYWTSLFLKKESTSQQNRWQHPNLHLDIKGDIMTDRPTNLLTIFTEHDKFKGRLSFNELTQQYCYDGREIHDMDYTRLRLDLCTELRRTFKKADVIDMAELVAKNNPFHPVKDYLNNLRWDQQDRMTIFCRLLSVEETTLNISVITKWLIAAVARIMSPGCKVDSIPVFQGTTGNRKSSALKTLMKDESWFTDEPFDFGSKDSKQILLGKWFVELAELSSMNGKENNLIKANITQTIDEFRSPYDRKPKKYPRQFVYIGTTNDSEFMNDSTSNRRFWIVQNNDIINTDKIKEIRDQLWAQAVSLYLAGEKWYLDRPEEQEMAEIASSFEYKDAWYENVVQYLEDKKFVTTTQILTFIKPNIATHDNRDRKRIVKIMQYLKWENKNGRVNGILMCGWIRSDKKRNIQQIIGQELPEATSILN
jgi:putative DNA primase/helicase